MGKEKRLFLLAVMTVMMSTVGYGAIIGNGGKSYNKPNENKEFNENPITVEKPKDMGYYIQASANGGDVSATIKTDITVNDGTGIQISIGEKGIGNTKVTNEGNLIVNKGTGVKLVKDKKNKNSDLKNEFINKGIIKVAGGKGIQLDNEKDIVVNEKEIIIDKDINGVGVSMSAGNFTNSETGTITIGKGGIGINIEKDGKVLNEGKIEVAGGTGIGVALNDSMFVNSGEIFGKGIAIQSVKGNNTIYLKNGSKVTGKIVGADGIDVLGLAGGTYSDLNVSNYEALTVRDGVANIKDSTIELEYNNGTKNYLDQAKEKMDEYDTQNKKSVENEKLTMSNSNLIIDFKDSLTNPNGSENPIIDVGADGKLVFKEGMKFDFTSSDGRDVFNLNEALGLKNGQIVVDGNFDDVFKEFA